MRAIEAREFTEKFKAKTSVLTILEQIKNLALNGKDFIRLNKKQINGYEVSVLREYGYKVEEVREDEYDYDRTPVLIGYNISW